MKKHKLSEEEYMLAKLNIEYGIRVEKVKIGKTVKYISYKTTASITGKSEEEYFLHDAYWNPVLVDTISDVYDAAITAASGVDVNGLDVTINTKFLGMSFGDLFTDLYALIALIASNSDHAWKSQLDYQGQQIILQDMKYFRFGLGSVFTIDVPIDFWDLFNCSECAKSLYGYAHDVVEGPENRTLIYELFRALGRQEDVIKFRYRLNDIYEHSSNNNDNNMNIC